MERTDGCDCVKERCDQQGELVTVCVRSRLLILNQYARIRPDANDWMGANRWQNINLKTAMEIAAKRRKSRKNKELYPTEYRLGVPPVGESATRYNIDASHILCAFCAFLRPILFLVLGLIFALLRLEE